MGAVSLRARASGRPVVATICRAPILVDALERTLGAVATVQAFPAGGGDTAGLLRALEPDAVVVDSDEEAAEALAFALESAAPLVHVSLRESRVRVLVDGRWEEPEGGQPSPEAIRNLLVEKIAVRGAVS